jgi:hypothetical protein
MSKYLIVGQGLAGTLLAFSLLEKGEEVLIADDYAHASASQVAAGMWNPVTFKRLAASWLVQKNDFRRVFFIPFPSQGFSVLFKMLIFGMKNQIIPRWEDIFPLVPTAVYKKISMRLSATAK